MGNVIKIKVSGKSRMGNNRPCGVAVLTVSENTSQNKMMEAAKMVKDAFNQSYRENKRVVLVIPDNVSLRWIKLK